ncbi:DNA-binding protein [Bacillus cereus]|nr:XRE family transcriptional regulator [Bacillus cereus]PFD01806.1 DNA-binding protein [Bacillus cereus]PFK65216.1 DNA-binding protein [Bacillus cereus]PGO13641.1 DNA-binding protein [Bacillus cereus]PGP05905.1 DNA-binding protein [Bacillus cereus]
MKGIKQFNPDRLKAARLYEGLTITDLANAINVSKQAVSQFEHGKNQPSLETLFEIMKVLNFPREFFYGKDDEKVQIGSTFFRSSATTNKKVYNAQIQKMLIVTKIYSFLEKYIDFPVLNLPKLEMKYDDYQNEDIEVLAQAVREYWRLGEEPIKNIVHLLEKNGLILTSLSTDQDKIDAFSQKQIVNGQERYYIVLGSDKKSAVRRQFTAAHELGHLLMHDWITDIDELSKEQYREIERQADYFAAAFLLPKKSFVADLHYPNKLEFYVELKKKWRVSIGAMIVRAYHLNVINYNQYQYLMRQMSSKGYRKLEPLDNLITIPSPTVLEKAIKLLIANNILTPKQILNHLELPKEKVDSLMDLSTDTLMEVELNVAPLIKLSSHSSNRRIN